MQVSNGTGPGVRKSKRPLLASRNRCNVLWKPPKFGNKVKIGNKVQFGNKFAHWCNVWSIEGVIVYGHVPECHVTLGRGRLHNVWWDPHIDNKTSWGTISNVPWHIPVRGTGICQSIPIDTNGLSINKVHVCLYSILKLVCTLFLNYRVLGTSAAAIFLSNDHSLYAPIYFGWMSCLISFEWKQSTCQERVESEIIQNEKFLLKVGLEPTALRSEFWCSTN